MKNEEVVLSDIHIYTDNVETDKLSNFEQALPCKWKNKLKVVQSRFVFKLPKTSTNSLSNRNKDDVADIISDEDGDLLVTRNQSFDKRVINLEHFMATPLCLVGLQVWPGGMLLADFIIHRGPEFLSNCCVLELGGGTGLCSIVASMSAKHVICTDCGATQLNLSKRNFERNSHLRYCDNERLESNSNTFFSAKELDWLSCEQLESKGMFGWDNEDKDHLSNVSILLAADVIYDNKLTDAFFETVLWLMNRNLRKTLYLSIEKRINFTIEALDVVSPAYDYFQQCLTRLETKLNAQQIKVDFPQYFQYERNPKLELWRFTSVS